MAGPFNQLPENRVPTTTYLQRVYHLLFEHFGPQHWWPADTPFEMAIGAILTQNTAWTNVEKAIGNLRRADALQVAALHDLPPDELQRLIRPAGFFRQKSERLQLFTAHLIDNHQGDIRRLLAQPLAIARDELLKLKGVGPETADSILLYAGGQPSFVIDAYTRRLFGRLDRLPGDGGYDDLRRMFMESLPASAAMFNEYHALIVILCKEYCRKRRPLCGNCPLSVHCPAGSMNR
ncbi:endonuclease III domain-containing protein [Geothermobacter hydrogeniphilus]|uniref:Endonuclease n=1 Tax=Geothermobacter hydrogeniphilus TaxID=1969733 RepID=A0A1X0XPY1_9BACT|nr:endonuclease [Geothermobacter hydrogeniphilus]ORJ54908.1 endonuclease [Geothermobacter hydrogeniphilus]